MPFDDLLGVWSKGVIDKEKKYIKYDKLAFKVPKSWQCSGKDGIFTCSSQDASIVIGKKTSPSPVSLGLVRLVRARDWQKLYKKQATAAKLETGLGELALQSINFLASKGQPVLLRAFDVVINDRDFLSIVEKINMSAWSRIKDEMGDFEKSLKKAK